ATTSQPTPADATRISRSAAAASVVSTIFRSRSRPRTVSARSAAAASMRRHAKRTNKPMAGASPARDAEGGALGPPAHGGRRRLNRNFVRSGAPVRIKLRTGTSLNLHSECKRPSGSVGQRVDQLFYYPVFRKSAKLRLGGWE